MGMVTCWLCPQGSTSKLKSLKGIVLHLTNVHKMGASKSGEIVEALSKEQRQVLYKDTKYRQEER